MRAHLRRPAVIVLAVATAALVVVHLLARPTGWRYEWRWAANQYAFLSLLLGPLAAAVGCYEGGRWRRVGDDSQPRASRLRVALRVWLALTVAAVGVDLLGLLVVAAVVRLAGTPGWLAPVDLLPPLAAVAAVAGWCAVGVAIGCTIGGGRILPAVTGCAALATAIVGYLSPGHIADIGSVTSSLTGLAIRWQIPASQAALWTVIGVVSLGLLARPRRAAATMGLLGAFVAVWIVGWQLRIGPDRFEVRADEVRCDRSSLTVCLAPGYEQFRTGLEPVRRSMEAQLRAAGAPRLVLTQDASEIELDLVAYLSDGAILHRDRTELAADAANALIPDGCDISDFSAGIAFDTVIGALSSPSTDARITAAAIASLRRCGAPEGG